jgi:hypothetical protein
MFTLGIPWMTALYVYRCPATMSAGRNMDVVLIAATGCFVLLGIAFGVVFTKLISRDRIFSPADILEAPFSPQRYRAMQRLLSEADQEFVSSHPGSTPRMQRNLRNVRIKIFRSYMHLLSEDFHRICQVIKLRMLTSEMDRSHLAGVVMKEQFRFAMGMWYAEFKLILYGFGWSNVNASSLVHSLETMRTQLQCMVAIVEPSAS